MALETMYTIQEVANYLKVDIRTVANWIAESKIRAGKYGHCVRIIESELKAFVIRGYRVNIKGWELDRAQAGDVRREILEREGILAEEVFKPKKK